MSYPTPRAIARPLAAALLSLTLVLPSAPVVAQTAPAATAPVADPSVLGALHVSAQLYLIGVEKRDALLVLAAAKLRKEVALDFKPAPGAAPSDGRPAPVTWEQMLDTARTFAMGDPAIEGLIDDVAAEGLKGVSTGQVYSISSIGIGLSDFYDNLTFTAGEYAEVYVESMDGSDLNIYVYDAEGRLVCSDTDPSPISYCGWRPAEEGEFTIKVENNGYTDAGYSLMTN